MKYYCTDDAIDKDKYKFDLLPFEVKNILQFLKMPESVNKRYLFLFDVFDLSKLL